METLKEHYMFFYYINGIINVVHSNHIYLFVNVHDYAPTNEHINILMWGGTDYKKK